MADEYQVTYEYSAGNSITFKTNNLSIKYIRHGLRIENRSGTFVVVDPGEVQRIYTFTARITGTLMDTLDSVQTAAITYSGAYPRITVTYWDGTHTETNTEVAMTELVATDMGNFWEVNITLAEKDQ